MDQNVERCEASKEEPGAAFNAGNEEHKEQVGDCEIQNPTIEGNLPNKLIFHQRIVDSEVTYDYRLLNARIGEEIRIVEDLVLNRPRSENTRLSLGTTVCNQSIKPAAGDC